MTAGIWLRQVRYRRSFKNEEHMRALVVYESLWGNTEKVARAIGDALSSHGTVDIFDSDAAPTSTDGYELLVVGAPTHAFSMSRPSTRADAVKSHAAPHAPVKGVREWLADLQRPPRRRRPWCSTLESTSLACPDRQRKPLDMTCTFSASTPPCCSRPSESTGTRAPSSRVRSNEPSPGSRRT